MEYENILDILAFVFTVFIVSYALLKGMDIFELSFNFIYFSVLILQQINALIRIFGND